MTTEKGSICLEETLVVEKTTLNKLFYLLAIIIMNLVFPPLLLLITSIGIIVSPVLFLCFRLLTHMKNDQIARQLIWIYGRFWLIIIAPFTSFHKENITRESIKEKSIIVTNHLSFFDTFCMSLMPIANISFAVGSWPFKIFFYRPFMLLANYLEIGENNWLETSEKGKKLLSDKCTLFFFPEGHRSRDGQLGRFYSGAFKLSIETGIPITPLCVTGTDNLLPPGRKWMEPSNIHLRALPPVNPKEFLNHPMPHLEMRKHVKKLMAENIVQMRLRESPLSH